ncbi:MAG: hypothetical protein OSA43_11175, partial [Pirellulales bacterium]|nr:hypothetical protein [Pirellulales bacterium]
LQDPSISQLAQGILDQLDDTPSPISEVVVTAKAVGAKVSGPHEGLIAEQALEKLDTMSDSEVEAMLSQMLDGEKGK